jgi:hypothetical protein
MLHLPEIAVVNRTTILDDVTCKRMVAAVQQQVSADFAPTWGQDAFVAFFSSKEIVPPNWWQMILADDSDQAGTLGYHQVTADDQPTGFVFAKTDAQFGLATSVTLSHEVLEILGDPYVLATALHQTSDVAGDVYALEICDACEDDKLAYDKGGVKVSDFVLPAYFQDGRPGPYSFRNNLSAPFSLAAGGYMSVFKDGWHQLNAEQPPTPRQQARVANGKFTRSMRRMNRK